jgi:DNA-binding CsgD family transcriptional regulator
MNGLLPHDTILSPPMTYLAPRTGAAPSPDGDAVSRLVGMAYDAALGDEDWLVLVQQMCGTVGATCGTLHPTLDPVSPDVAVRFNIDPDMVEPYNRHYCLTVPKTPELLSLRAKVGFNFYSLMPEPDFVRTEFYNDFTRLRGMHSCMMWVDADQRGLHGHLSLWRPRHRPTWEQPELRILRVVGVHVSRALEIQRRLAATASRAAAALAGSVIAPRERDCLARVARGASSKVIGRELGLSMHTVNAYLAAARRKLGAASRSEAVAIAYEQGLIGD